MTSTLPTSTLLEPSLFPPSVTVAFYHISGRKGRQAIKLEQPLIPTAFTLRRLVGIFEDGFWDRSGLNCNECLLVRTSLRSLTKPWAMTAVECCPHGRGDDDFQDEDGNAAVASLFGNGCTPVAGNLVVFKHTDDPSLPGSLLDTRPLNVEKDDQDFIDAYVRRLYGSDAADLGPNEFGFTFA